MLHLSKQVIGDLSSSAHPALIFSTSSRCCAAIRRCYACTFLVHVGSSQHPQCFSASLSPCFTEPCVLRCFQRVGILHVYAITVRMEQCVIRSSGAAPALGLGKKVAPTCLLFLACQNLACYNRPSAAAWQGAPACTTCMLRDVGVAGCAWKGCVCNPTDVRNDKITSALLVSF